ncbi:unnamed protein product [Rotaria sordida]|uniref:Uncharacterized protein n=1 Tax=Rotaria sordida TaxID=392033 RepID=A0A815HVZ7_9BILA|nr:unnamed protein product [Rotaria sordida]
MSSVSTAIYNLFVDYPIPTNNNQDFVCSHCRCATGGRNRRYWLTHLKQCNQNKFNNIVESILAINGAIQRITGDDNHQHGIINNNSFKLVEENETSTEEYDSQSYVDKMAQLIQAHEKHELNDEQFIAATKEFWYKENPSSKPSS